MKKINIFLFTVGLLFAQTVLAGFPLGKGGYVVVPTYNFYSAKGFWNASRQFKSTNDKFTSNYFGLYGGFGLSRDLDFMYNLPYSVQTSTPATGKASSTSGLGDAQLGFCYYLNHYDNYKHLGFTGSLILPLYQNTSTPVLGFQSFGLEGKLGIAGSSEMGFRNAYYDIEAGVRQYFSISGPTQLFTNITGGLPVSDKWKLSGTLSGVSSSSNSKSFNVSNLAGNQDFDYIRLTANAGYIINENTTIWGGVYTDVIGRNTGKGSGLSLFAVFKF